MAFPRNRRLVVGLNALRGGRSLSLPSFLAKYAPNGLPHHRFGVVVGKKAGKTAVARHLIKRVITEKAATWRAQAGADGARIAAGYDILFIASPRLASLSPKDLRIALQGDLVAIRTKLSL